MTKITRRGKIKLSYQKFNLQGGKMSSLDIPKKNDQTTPNISQNQKIIQKIKQKLWRGKREKIRTILITLSAIILVFFGWTIYSRYFHQPANDHDNNNSKRFLTKINPVKKTPPPKFSNPLSGTKYKKELAERHPLAVVIENHPDARPQSGLSKAEIVYEAIAEGGITRFLAIFGPRDASEVGPIRSARTFFLDWTLEYDAYFVHAGESKDARARLRAGEIQELPPYARGYFERHRRPGIASEHTLYSSTPKLYQLAKEKKISSKAQFTSLDFKNDADLANRGNQEKITIPFSTHSYQVDWLYDKEQNIYKRVMAGKAHKDKIDGTQITAKNIIIQQVNRHYITFPSDPTAKGVWRFNLIGTGKAWIARDGKLIEGKWRKSSKKERTKFYDKNGEEIKFNRGIFWYEIIPPEVKIKETQKTTQE